MRPGGVGVFGNAGVLKCLIKICCDETAESERNQLAVKPGIDSLGWVGAEQPVQAFEVLVRTTGVVCMGLDLVNISQIVVGKRQRGCEFVGELFHQLGPCGVAQFRTCAGAS